MRLWALRWVLAFALVAGVAAGGALIVHSASAQPGPRSDPTAAAQADVSEKIQQAAGLPQYASDEERDAAFDRLKADFYDRQTKFVREFIDSGEDIHSLPAAYISATLVGATTVEQAVATASAGAVRGRVVGQSIGAGLILSKFEADEWIFGNGNPGILTIAQTGGPGLSVDGPVFLQLYGDPVLEKGHEYVLFLAGEDDPSEPGVFRIGVVGHQFEVIEGVLRMPAALANLELDEPFELTDVSLDAARARIRAEAIRQDIPVPDSQ